MQKVLALGDRILSAMVPSARAAAAECDYIKCAGGKTKLCCVQRNGSITCGACR
ncbi:hypothetical protein ACFHYQ_24670 [Sphaerimonospora cavernae]|uniref:Uncharacterized protein n=1 Tax=Sphaerimonospora cavernae TaxID=1740611 RepID=A0ABV6UBF1_9ACTN